jgi:D-glycero-D-manno-heptose 1,7-bisphosphate phosphatase
MNKAVFIDRDGTINEEVDYLKHVDDLNVFPYAIEALQILKK